MNFRRLISFLLIFCLTFSQVAQAYSLARLPCKYQHTTSYSRTDGANQSCNRSGLTGNSGNLTVIAGGNIIGTGADFAANAGNIGL